MDEIVNKNGDRQKIQGYTGVYHPVQGGNGQPDHIVYQRKNPIVRAENKMEVGVVAKHIQVHGDGKKREDHPRYHHQKEPAKAVLIFLNYQNDRENEQGENPIKHRFTNLESWYDRVGRVVKEKPG